MTNEVILTNRVTEEEWQLRYKVFIAEQKFSFDYDNLDTDPAVIHALIKCDGKAAAAGRLIPRGNGAFSIGRVAVAKEFRKCGLGAQIISVLEKEAQKQGGSRILISSQLHAQKFYEKSGYTAYGGTYYEEYCRHIHMEKELI